MLRGEHIDISLEVTGDIFVITSISEFMYKQTANDTERKICDATLKTRYHDHEFGCKARRLELQFANEENWNAFISSCKEDKREMLTDKYCAHCYKVILSSEPFIQMFGPDLDSLTAAEEALGLQK